MRHMVLREVGNMEFLVWFLSLSLEMVSLLVPEMDGVGRGEWSWWRSWNELGILT